MNNDHTHDVLCPPERMWEPSACMCDYIRAIREDERKRIRTRPRTCTRCLGSGQSMWHIDWDKRKASDPPPTCPKCGGKGTVAWDTEPDMWPDPMPSPYNSPPIAE